MIASCPCVVTSCTSEEALLLQESYRLVPAKGFGALGSLPFSLSHDSIQQPKRRSCSRGKDNGLRTPERCSRARDIALQSGGLICKDATWISCIELRRFLSASQIGGGIPPDSDFMVLLLRRSDK